MRNRPNTAAKIQIATKSVINSARKRGFTIVEMVITAAIVGVAATIAATAVMRARDKAATAICIGNLEQIARAKSIWALEKKAGPSDSPPESELFGSGNYLKTKPVCPLKGKYTIGTVGEAPTCDWSGHVLP